MLPAACGAFCDGEEIDHAADVAAGHDGGGFVEFGQAGAAERPRRR